MPHRKFDAPTPPADHTPITFEWGDHTYRCLPSVPVGISALASGRLLKVNIPRFIEGVLVEEDVPAWHAALVAKTPVLDDSTTESIFWFLIEAYGGQKLSVDDLPPELRVPQPAVGDQAD